MGQKIIGLKQGEFTVGHNKGKCQAGMINGITSQLYYNGCGGCIDPVGFEGKIAGAGNEDKGILAEYGQGCQFLRVSGTHKTGSLHG